MQSRARPVVVTRDPYSITMTHNRTKDGKVMVTVLKWRKLGLGWMLTQLVLGDRTKRFDKSFGSTRGLRSYLFEYTEGAFIVPLQQIERGLPWP
jgi:hypothetical protein